MPLGGFEIDDDCADALSNEDDDASSLSEEATGGVSFRRSWWKADLNFVIDYLKSRSFRGGAITSVAKRIAKAMHRVKGLERDFVSIRANIDRARSGIDWSNSADVCALIEAFEEERDGSRK